jgi:hypothetical protein
MFEKETDAAEHRRTTLKDLAKGNLLLIISGRSRTFNKFAAGAAF